MNTKLFSEAISEVGDKYYEEAANYHCKKHGWIKWSAMAACLTIVLFTAFSILPDYFPSEVLHRRIILTELLLTILLTLPMIIQRL